MLRTCFEKLSRAQASAEFEEPVELAVVLEQLTGNLSQDQFGAGYLTGGVTFCALKPMRSIPAKVICLLGMNDTSFPRTSAELSFDLMAQKRQLGDRSSREDDRYLFLETLISARDRLYISYVGQSIKDNSEAPPSVLVSELLDYIAQGFELPGKDVIQDQVLTRHRLQAFSTEYFRPGRLFSYSRENFQASQVICPERNAPGEFTPELLAEPEPEWRRVNLQTLTEFLCHPARFLATKRLLLRLPSETSALEEREAFAIAGLDSYQLKQELLGLRLGGLSLKNSCNQVRASGRLPAGRAGDVHFAQVRRDVEVFYKRLRPFKPESCQASSGFELAIGQFVMSGVFSRVTPDGLLFYRPATIKPKDLLRAWVEHLLWNANLSKGQPANTTVVGTDSTLKIAPVSDPRTILGALLDLYWAGLCRPLKFFPESSYAFAAADYRLLTGTKGKTVKTPLDFAEQKWNGSDFGAPGECQDEYFALFFRNGNCLDGEFETNARGVFHPLLEVAEEVKE